MSEHEHYESLWRSWRHSRIAALTHPYGWSSPVAQQWLREGDTNVRHDLLPGVWSVQDGNILYTPTPDDGDAALTVAGERVSDSLTIPVARHLVSDHPHPALIFSRGREIEGITRSTSTRETIYAVRMRDPEAAQTPATLAIDSHDYTHQWRLPATFTPHSAHDVVRQTIEEGVVDVVDSIGTVTFTSDDTEQSLVVFARHTLAGTQPYTHFRDATSGSTTHGNGRMLDLDFPLTGQQVSGVIDFNYSYVLPCALTPFVSCPIPISENILSLTVNAGERDRILTGS